MSAYLFIEKRQKVSKNMKHVIKMIFLRFQLTLDMKAGFLSAAEI